MTSKTLWTLNALAGGAALLAGWFALNAPEIARPDLQSFERVRLPQERPPLPPAPFIEEPPSGARALAERGLFLRSPSRGRRRARQPLPEIETPIARAMLAPVTAARPRRAPLTDDARQPFDPFRARLAAARPRFEQFYGGHLLPNDIFETDGAEAPTPDAPDDAPLSAPEPRPRPSRAARPDAPSAAPPSAPPAAAAAPSARAAPAPPPAAAEETAPSVAAAATSRAADLETYEVDGLILLGVLQGRDASHALVRVPDLGVVKVRQGDQLKDWRVFAIGDDHLRLRNDRGSRLLRLPSAAE